MSAVRVPDILYRAGGATLARLQTLVSAGGGRVTVSPTFTRATVKRAFRDRDGNAKRAAAGKLATDWPTGLVDASGNAIGGPLGEGARTQLVTDPENFGAWSVNEGTPGVVSGQSDPFGGTAAYSIEDNNAASLERIFQTVTFTGDGTKALAISMKQSGTNKAVIGLYDVTAGVFRHEVGVPFASGVPSLTSDSGSGALFQVESLGGGWYRLPFSAAGVIAANTNIFLLNATDASAATTGSVLIFGANAWNAPFPQSYQAPGESTGVADSLTSPFNWGPQADITVLVRLGRPTHADAGASTALGISPGIFSFGAGSAARIGAYFDPAARNIISVIDTATTDATQTTAIPAGNPTICIQYRNLTTGGSTRIDTGAGFTAWSSAATAFSAFSSQTLRIGRYDDELYGAIGDMIVARGVDFTRSEMMAVL